MIPERLQALRQEMAQRNIAIYVVPTADYHESEYVGEHFKARKYITGFSGSAGTAVITMTEAGLWTDGRYFVQAAEQLAGTTVTLYKMGEEGVPTVNEYIAQTLQGGECIGFDGRVVNGAWGKQLQTIAEGKHGSLYVKEDLIDRIWEDRPALSREPIRILDVQYAGKSTADKIADVRAVMEQKGADIHLLTSLYDIAWLLNVRGGDISYVPVVLSYLALTKEKCIWFVQKEAIDEKAADYLKQNQIEVRPYEAFYGYVAEITEEKAVLLNPATVNYRACSSLQTNCRRIEEMEPTVFMKSVKNQTEVDNTRNAHVKDAVAMCKFMYWLKTNIGKIPMSEISVADYLQGLREEQDGFLDLSFGTIAAYGEHGAICHYSAVPETDSKLKPEGFLLVDSGGHYYEGTTDITRTFALGPITEEMRRDFTLICISNMNLANARFLYGCTGQNLDILARGPLWNLGLDFKHGTGHGVGYVLNVHEGPNGFRWKTVSERNDGAVLEAGMITTDEPGIYIEGKYGIRTENELVCQMGEKNEYGQFMYFENITYVPIDLDAIDPDLMTSVDKKRLNDYHGNVYRVVSPYLNDEEREWLKQYTRAI